MFKISKDKLEKRYGYIAVKTIPSTSSNDGTTIYTKKGPGDKVTILYYDNASNIVLRQNYYTQIEIDTLIEVNEFLKGCNSANKAQKTKRKNNKENPISKYFRSLVKLNEQVESFYVK